MSQLCIRQNGVRRTRLKLEGLGLPPKSLAMPGFFSCDRSTMPVLCGKESPKAVVSTDPPKYSLYRLCGYSSNTPEEKARHFYRLPKNPDFPGKI